MLPITKVILIALGGGLALFLALAVVLYRKGIAAHLSHTRASRLARLSKPVYAEWMKAAKRFEDIMWESLEFSGTTDWTRNEPGFAEKCYEKAIAACEPEGRSPTEQAAAQAGLARVKLFAAQIGQAPVANLYESITLSKRALQTYTVESNLESWGSAQLTLAAAHSERNDSSHSDLEQATELCEEVLEHLREQSDLPSLLCGQAHYTKADAHFKQGDLQSAEKHYGDARALLESDGDRKQQAAIANRRLLARTLCGLGRIRLGMIDLSKVKDTNDQETIVQAKLLNAANQYFQRAAAAARVPLARVSPELSEARDRIADIYHLGLQFPPELVPDSLSTPALRRRQATLMRQKAEVGASPAQIRDAAMKRGDLYFRYRGWKPALKAYQHAIDADKTLFYHSITEQGRHAFAGSGERAYRHATFCLINLGSLDEAVLTLDRGKTRVMSERLNRDQAQWNLLKDHQDRTEYEKAFKDLTQKMERLEIALQSGEPGQDDTLTVSVEEARDNLRRIERRLQREHPDFLVGLSLEDLPLLVADNQTAIVVPVLTVMGGAAILVTAQGCLDAVELAQFDLPAAENLVWKLEDEDVRQWLAAREDGNWSEIVSQIAACDSADMANRLGWVPAYRLHYAVANVWYGSQDCEDAYRITQQWWWDVMQRTLEDLYRTFWSPILEALPDQVERLIVVPQGVLHLIPAGAAREREGDEAIIDRYTVSYAPSLNVLQKCRQAAEAAATTRPSLLAAIGSQSAGRLPNAKREIDAIAHIWREHVKTESQLLRADVTEDAFLERAAYVNYIHYSGHAEHDRIQPENSGLLVESDNPLTVDDIGRKGALRTSRLVVLSACETGLVDMKTAPEEYVGLPAAFMLAGVPCVVSSLWPVEDLSTALLMARFYEIHLKEGLPPSQALRAAKRWLRTATREQIIMHCESYGWMNLNLRIDLAKGEDNRYSNPYFWASFISGGV